MRGRPHRIAIIIAALAIAGGFAAVWFFHLAAPRQAANPNEVKCAPKSGLEICMKKKYVAIAEKQGVPVALEKLAKASRHDLRLRSRCHNVAHTIGSVGLRQAKGNIGEAIMAGPASCGAGYPQGVVDTALGNTKSTEELRHLLRTACVTRAESIRQRCTMGVGHAMFLRHSDIGKAWDDCSLLSMTQTQITCGNAAIMEMLFAPSGRAVPVPKPGQPDSVCEDVPAPIYNSCVSLLPAVWARTKGIDYPRLISTCRELAPQQQTPCLRGVGQFPKEEKRVTRICNRREPVYSYDDRAQATSWTLNGITTLYAYDSLGNLVSAQHCRRPDANSHP